MHLSLKDQLLFFNQMATMLGAGVSLQKALNNISQTTRSMAQRKFAMQMIDYVTQGKMMSEAMEKLRGISDEFIINLVKVGEEGGFIDVKFKEIADYLERVYNFRMKFLTNLIYPLILFHASIILPPLFYLFLGDVVSYLRLTLTILIPFYAVVIFFSIIYIALANVKGIRIIFDWFFAYLPLVGGVISKQAVARFTRALASLYEAGVVVSASIKIAASACGNAVISNHLAKIVSLIDSGVPLAQALERTRLFSPTAIQLIATGEESGETARLLYKTADYLDSQLEETAKRFFIVFPILLYVLMGIYVGYIFITKFIEFTQIFFMAL